jgi:glycerophosphoryl diester phosphodiesterase
MKRMIFIILSIAMLTGFHSVAQERIFIAHRGVNMRYVAAGENSIEAIRLAKRAGFKAIETDVRLTADSVLVAMHDHTLRRTCLNPDGSRVDKSFKVADFTIEQLKKDFVLRSPKEEMRTQTPTLEEYLKVCKEEGLLVFIEPKLNDPTGKHYLDIMACADTIFGRGNYIITSNNFANGVIIDSLGIKDVPLMGILYQTTYEDIASKPDVIMAISTSRFEPEAYAANVVRSKADGLQTESHADDFEHFDMINNADIDYVSTDFLAPDWNGQGKTLALIKGKGMKKVQKASETCAAMPAVPFGAIYLEMEFAGKANVGLADQKFTAESESLRLIRHQILLSDMQPVFELSDMSDDFTVNKISVRVVEYQ